MAILKFRIYFEEDDSIYRDIAIRPIQSFYDLHEAILRAYDFDSKHKATFYRSNDHWEKGREISLEVYEKDYRVPPLEMKQTTIGSEIRIPNQKFIYHYDFNKNWSFLVELINVAKDENPKLTYPSTIRVEGIAPSQYGTKGLLGEKFADVEEKYDLSQTAEGFIEEGESEEKTDLFGGNGVEEEGETEGESF
jgi:pRiA4b ORF-3-like protein